MESYLCSWIGRVNIVKMTVLMKPIYILNVVPIKFPMVFYRIKKKKKALLKFVWNHQSCRRLGFDPRVWKIPWRRKWQPTLVFLSGKISCTEGAWQATDHKVTKESDMTDRATECKPPWIAKAILRKNNKARGITLPEFKLHYKAIVIRAVWYWPRDKPKHMQSTNIWQRSQDTQEKTVSLINGAGIIGYSHVKEWK